MAEAQSALPRDGRMPEPPMAPRPQRPARRPPGKEIPTSGSSSITQMTPRTSLGARRQPSTPRVLPPLAVTPEGRSSSKGGGGSASSSRCSTAATIAPHQDVESVASGYSRPASGSSLPLSARGASPRGKMYSRPEAPQQQQIKMYSDPEASQQHHPQVVSTATGVKKRAAASASTGAPAVEAEVADVDVQKLLGGVPGMASAACPKTSRMVFLRPDRMGRMQLKEKVVPSIQQLKARCTLKPKRRSPRRLAPAAHATGQTTLVSRAELNRWGTRPTVVAISTRRENSSRVSTHRGTSMRRTIGKTRLTRTPI